MTSKVDVAVIGAGPAGMAAAIAARRHGLSCTVFDEGRRPGGQIYRDVSHRPDRDDTAILGAEYYAGRDLVSEFEGCGAGYRADTLVWYVTDGDIHWTSRDSSGTASATRVIATAGAMERPFPIPGWTLPGVLTAGAAQILLKTAGLVTTGAVFVGCGPLLYLVAAQYCRAGFRPQLVLETVPRQNYLYALPHLPRALRASAYLLKGLGLIRELRQAGVRLVRGVEALEILGDCAASGIKWRLGARWHEQPANQIILHQGLVPNVNLGMGLRCEHRWSESQRCWRPALDDWGRSSLPWLWIAGDGGGIAGAAVARLGGTLAALDVATDLGVLTPLDRDRIASPIRRARQRDMAIRPFLEALYRPADSFRAPDRDDIVVCRCEEVTRGEIAAATREGAAGPNQLKGYLRCGMGPCQGRMCGHTVTELMASLTGRSPEEVGYFRLRMPLKPVAVGEVAGIGAGEDG